MAAYPGQEFLAKIKIMKSIETAPPFKWNKQKWDTRGKANAFDPGRDILTLRVIGPSDGMTSF